MEKHRLTETLFREINANLQDHVLLLKQGILVDATAIGAPRSTYRHSVPGRNKCRRVDRSLNNEFRIFLGVEFQHVNAIVPLIDVRYPIDRVEPERPYLIQFTDPLAICVR